MNISEMKNINWTVKNAGWRQEIILKRAASSLKKALLLMCIHRDLHLLSCRFPLNYVGFVDFFENQKYGKNCLLDEKSGLYEPQKQQFLFQTIVNSHIPCCLVFSSSTLENFNGQTAMQKKGSVPCFLGAASTEEKKDQFSQMTMNTCMLFPAAGVLSVHYLICVLQSIFPYCTYIWWTIFKGNLLCIHLTGHQQKP